MDEGCTYVVQTMTATDASAAQRSFDAPLRLVQKRFHSWESKPKGQQHHSHSRRLNEWRWHLGIQITQGEGLLVHLELYTSHILVDPQDVFEPATLTVRDIGSSDP